MNMDGLYQMLDRAKFKSLVSYEEISTDASEAGKDLVESCTFQSYSFEGFYTYAAVEVLRDAGYSLEETIDILR